MEKTAKEHFKAMYQAVRNNRFPSSIVDAALDASDDFGRGFAVGIAVAARRAQVTHIQSDVQTRLRRFKRQKAEPFDEGLPF